jgi:MATE family multidrug resistance protein
MWVNVAASVVNMALDPLLIFGLAGFPEWGVRGAAIATAIANCFSASLFAVLILRDRDAERYGVARQWRFDSELFSRLLRFGLPQGVNMFFDVICFTVFVVIVGTFGKSQLAATNLAFTMNIFAFVPLLGVGTAVTTLVGNRIGEGRPDLAARTTWLAFGLCTSYILVFAFIYVALPGLILFPFQARSEMDAASFAEMRALVVVLLRFVAVYAIFDAMAIVFGAAIRGAGDTRFPMVYSVITGWTLMVIPAYVARTYFNLGILTAWTGTTAFIVALGLGFLWRFQRGRWKSMRIIEDQPTSSHHAPRDEPRCVTPA